MIATPPPTLDSSTPLPSATEADRTQGDEPAPTAPDDAQSAALEHARQSVELYARPTTPQPQWFAELQPLLSSYAGSLFVNVDPTTITATTTTGEPAFEQPPNAYFARVRVSTDAGDFIVSLERLDVADPWLTDRIDPAS